MFVLNCVDGCIPSDLATGTREEIEEERRLLYVAMTRAKEDLELIVPRRFMSTASRATATGTCWRPHPLPAADAAEAFQRNRLAAAAGRGRAGRARGAGVDLKARMRAMWG